MSKDTIHLFNNLSVKGIVANGSTGTAGEILHSNGTAAYWAIDDNSGGTVTSIATANGLSGGPITTTGTIGVVSGSTLTVNASGIHVNTANLSVATSQLTGDVALGTNTSGNYVATITNANGISGSSSTEGGAATIGVVTGSTLTVNTTGIHVNSALSITDLALTGNLTVSGTRTYVNTTTIDVGDNILTLNADLGANPPTENAGIEIMRGTSANVQFIWDETNDRWSTNSQPLAISSLVAAGAASGITTLAAGNTTITGFVNATASVNSAILSVGTSFIANTSVTTITDTTAAANSTQVLAVKNGSYALGVAPNAPAGAWNSLTTAGDTLIIATGNSGIGNANLAIIPWSGASGGIRMATVANSTTIGITGNTTITGFANVSTTLQVGTNTATFGTAAYIVANGNVGIGTNTPGGYRLRVVGSSGSAQFRAGTDANGYFEINAFDSAPVYCVVAGANATAGVFGTQTNIPTIFFTNNTERMRIDSSGNVGIGTIAPGYLLQGVQNGNAEFRVSSTNAGTNSAGLTVENQGNRNWNLWANRATDKFIIGANNRANDFLSIDGSSGNVGIGTSSPGAKLDVSSSASNIVASRSTGGYAAFQRIAPSGQTAYDFYTINGVEAARIAVDGSNIMSFATGSAATERMRIDASGSVIAAVDMRAPIFYDSANTSFYTDPAGTSNLLGLTVTNRITGSITGTTFTNDATNKANITTRTDSGFYEHDTGTTAEGWPLNDSSWQHLLSVTHSNDSNYYAMQFAASFYSNSPFYRSTNGSGTTAWSRFALYDNAYSSNLRATIFYDNDNTAYYFDGSSTGTSIFTAGGMQLYGQDGFRFSSASAITTMRFGSAFTGESTAELGYNRATGTTTLSQGNSGSALTQTIGITTTGLTLAGGTHYIRTDKLLLQHDGTHGYIRSENAGSHLYLGGSNQNTVQIATGNYLFSQGSVRSPIFYDSDDTARFFNGAGGINFLTGTSNRVNIYSDDSGFYVSNAEGNAGLLRLGAAYSLTGVYVNPSLYLQSENTIFFRTQNVQRMSIDSSGILSVSGDVRAPIYYDSNNTAYYVNAASTSNIGSTYVNGYFQIQYGSQYSGMGIRNNYGSASLTSTSFIDFINENGYQKASVFGVMATDGAGYLQFLSTAIGVSRSADTRTTTGYAYSNQWQFVTSAGITSNIFYDRDNTSYYTDPNGNSVLSTLYMIGNLTMDPGGLIVGRTSASTDVNVANDTGSFSARGNTSTIASMSFHRAGAYAINMGLGTDNVLRIGGWSASNNCMQITGTGNIYALGDFRAPTFYNSNDTIVRWVQNELVLRGGSPTVFFRDTDHNSAMLHCNSNLFYVLRGGNDTESWSTVGSGNWPLVISLSNNDATFGGNLTAIYSMYAESYYDRNDSAYYADLAGNNRMRNLNLGGGAGFDASLHMVGAQGGYDRLTQMGPNSASKPGLNILASRSAGNADQWWAWGPTAANVWCINSGTALGTGGIQIDTSGNLTAAANVTAYSDLRLKKNIVQITDAIAKVKAIRGVMFERIDNGSKGTGVIAQEIEKVLPEVVLEDHDGIKSVAYGNMVGLLIEAIKEQQVHINRLEQKINSLENK